MILQNFQTIHPITGHHIPEDLNFYLETHLVKSATIIRLQQARYCASFKIH